jgi:hypothetical protein
MQGENSLLGNGMVFIGTTEGEGFAFKHGGSVLAEPTMGGIAHLAAIYYEADCTLPLSAGR